MIAPVKVKSAGKELLCHQYWRRVLRDAETQTPKEEINCVSAKGSILFNFVNDVLAKAMVNLYKSFNEKEKCFHKSFQKAVQDAVSPLEVNKTEVKPFEKMLAEADLSFRQLKPLKKEKILYRGVCDTISDKHFLKGRFDRCYETKKGDIVYMPEYAFASDSKDFAEIYTGKYIKNSDVKSILYRITVPKGSRISHNLHYNFPRSSKFECTNTEEIGNLRVIDLTYILPKSDELVQENGGIKSVLKNLFNRIKP